MTREDRFVERLRREIPACERVIVGPGDDAAIVAWGGSRMAWTTDLLVEAVDFLSGESPDAVGRRAVSVNLSDLAAVGAQPELFLLSIGFPSSRGEEYAFAVARGANARACEFGMTLAGGDLSASSSVVVSVAAWGALAGEPLLRSGARPGDAVFVSGFPGRAAAGLRLERSRLDDEGGTSGGRAARILEQDRALVAAYRDPEPRVALGLRLASELGATAAIDLSDGLGIDSGRLARASAARLILELERLPIDPALAAFAAREGLDAVELALAGGDDYELLFTVPPSRAEALERPGATEDRITRIGRVEAGTGAFLRGPAGDRDVASLGYDHFDAEP